MGEISPNEPGGSAVIAGTGAGAPDRIHTVIFIDFLVYGSPTGCALDRWLEEKGRSGR